MNLTPEQIAELADDGDVLKLDDGRMLRLRLAVDEDTSINDFDGFGKTEQYSHRYIYEEGRAQRPSNFTGNSEKVQISRGDWIWWEPPTNGPKRGTPEFVEFRQQVRDLLECGFYVVTLELCDGTDAYGRPIVVDMTSLGGVDDVSSKYLPEVVADIAWEIAE